MGTATSRLLSHSRGYPRALPSTGATPPGSEAPLPKHSFFIAGPRVLDRPTSVETQTRWMRGFPGCVCIVDLQLRKDWAANDRGSIQIY